MTEKENHLPNLSSEERAHALELAIQARRRYAALKARWFPGKPETPQKRHGKGCGGTPFSMPFLLSH